MEIEVGEYVRTNKGNITKMSSEEFIKIMLENKSIFGKALKHSKNIIDLVEVGDYVNEERITDKWDTRISSIRSNFSEEDIKTILTKEQYMANCYKVGGEDGN